MAEITVTFEDGAAERLPSGTTAADALRVRIRDSFGWESITPKQGELFQLPS